MLELGDLGLTELRFESASGPYGPESTNTVQKSQVSAVITPT